MTIHAARFVRATSIRIALALVALLMVHEANAQVAMTNLGFTPLRQPPSEEDRECASYSDVEWSLSMDGGRLKAARSTGQPVSDALPFTISATQQRGGQRSVVPVSDGWLVGFDHGEWGGGLWWYSQNGRTSRQLRPSPNAPAHPEDQLPATNVRGFALVGGDVLVLMGRDHVTLRSGRVFRAVREGKRWTLAPVAVLDGSPDAWVVEGTDLLALTQTGLWRVAAGREAEQIAPVMTGGLYPNSLVRGPDSALYVGMRRFVVRMHGDQDRWHASWWVSKDCAHAKVVGSECVCQR